MMTAELTVQHNPDRNRFEIWIGEYLAELVYTLKDGVITFTHTGVPPALEGRGLGSKLARAGLEYARQNGLKVVSTCWFINGYLDRNLEYQDLLKKN
ncbi:MAG: N-acetyltransferase [Anaerolineae bacterium]|nr:MAG: N-acetyltransferase [Anaerolineae bacterium]